MKQFIVLGIINGAVYSLLALGLVLIYKGARVFNFAQGEFGTVTVFITWLMFARWHIPYGLAIVGGLLAAALIGFLTERLVVRPLFNAPRVTLLVATAGITLGCIQLEQLLAGKTAQRIDAFIPGKGVSVFGVLVEPQKFIIIGILAVLAVGIAYFFTRTDRGLAVLATSQEPVATELVGIGTKRISSLIWVMAAVLGGIAGLALAPTNVFFPGFMTVNALLPAFTAAVLGGITSLPGAFVGGQIVGISESLGAYASGHVLHDKILGFQNLLVFAILVGVLLWRPRGLLGTEA